MTPSTGPTCASTPMTLYLMNSSANVLSATAKHYDLSPTAGSTSNGLYPQTNQTMLVYGAGASGPILTRDNYIQPGNSNYNPGVSQSAGATSWGYGWMEPTP